MLGCGTATIEFEEPDLTAALPQCAAAVAAALYFGYRLVPAPHVNHEDVISGDGLKRLRQVKDVKRSTLRRTVRWHFLGTSRALNGETLETAVKVFFRRWREEAALRRPVLADPRYERWRVKVCELLSRNRQAVLASEGGRFCYGKLRGDAETLADFSNMMEEGF